MGYEVVDEKIRYNDELMDFGEMIDGMELYPRALPPDQAAFEILTIMREYYRLQSEGQNNK